MQVPRKSKAYQAKLKQAKEKIEEHQSPPEPTAEQPQRPRTMQEWRSLIDERIQNAIADGHFDNLPGKGKPLNLTKNPYADPAEELANHLLKSNNFAPEWIERDKDIRQELAAARERLRAAWRFYQPDPKSQPGWQSAVSRFEEIVKKLNRQIDDYNLIVPILSKQRFRIRLADELRLVQGEPPPTKIDDGGRATTADG